MKKQDYNSQFGTITCPYCKSEFAYKKSEDIEVISNGVQYINCICCKRLIATK